MVGTVQQVRIEDIDDSANVRRDLGDIETLTESLTTLGLLQPVRVAKSDDGLVLVCGHRRVAAARAAGIESITAVIVEESEPAELTLAMLVENLQRVALDPIDEAEGYDRLVGEGWSLSQIADQVGRSKGHVSRRRSLLRLPEALQERVRSGELATGHAYQVSRLVPDVPAEALARLATASPFSVAYEIGEIKHQRRLRHHRDELRKAGLRVVDGAIPAEQRLAVLGIDPDEHRTEPCHIVTAGVRGVATKGPVETVEGCEDPDRHTPRSAPEDPTSDCGTGSAEPELGEWQIRRAEREQARAAWYRSTGAQLRDCIDDDEAMRYAVLLVGYERGLLGIPDDDPLLPHPGGPVAKVDHAPVADVARAMVREYLEVPERNSAYRVKATEKLAAEIRAKFRPETAPEETLAR